MQERWVVQRNMCIKYKSPHPGHPHCCHFDGKIRSFSVKKKLLAAKGRLRISNGPKGPPKYLGGLWPLKVAFS